MGTLSINKRLILATSLLIAGCAGPTPTAKWGQTPDKPVASPPARNMPLDLHLRDAAEQELNDAQHSDDPFLRAHAIEARQDVHDPVAQNAVITGLSDPSPVVRFSAAMAAGRLHIAAVAPVLQKLLDDPDTNVRVGAIYALYELGDKHPAHELEKLAFDPDIGVRGNTAMVIGMMGNQSGLRVLRAMATDVSWTVRIQVAESRWQLGNIEGLTDLVSGTVSKYPNEQMESLLGLARPMDPRIAEHVRHGLTSEYPEVALVAARAMGELGSDEGYGVAREAANRADPGQRALAALAFGAIGRRDAQPMLEELLKDTDPNVRVAAATAILQLK